MGEILPIYGSEDDAGLEKWIGKTKYKCAYYDGSSPVEAHMVKGSLCVLGPDYAATSLADSKNPYCAPVTTSAVYREFGVTTATLTEAGWYWFAIEGEIDTLCVEGTTDIGVGDTLKPVNNENYAVQDHATTMTASAVAVAREAFTTNGEGTIAAYLLGFKATVA